MESILKLEAIDKIFYLERKKWNNVWRNPFRKRQEKLFQALENISFEVKKGECVGLIGLNGSGKSTLANIIAGHLAPTSGRLEQTGSVSLLAIGSALKPNLTGVENIQLKMLLMGFKPKEIENRIQNIIQFTELQDFINQPLKQYSSGMRARLGFGIAIQTDPDVLIIDEALSVGDSTFYQKCVDEIERMKKAGKTIFFVSHSLKQIRDICDKVGWLHYGHLNIFGDSEEVCLEYSKFIHHFSKKTPDEKHLYQKEMISKQKKTVLTKQKYEKLKFPVIYFTALLLLFMASASKLLGLW
ncbi:teichoic acid export protein ATP-binding subunit [Listeria newyorkensis]|uniref:Teichoic acid export protein ATP-binding subunit n=1 Tax=Listeria newyorkensis TaxID=1497681 RepID=A0ABX4XQ56_9LIST|nr:MULTISPECIES: ABC transporter ATP-binding protein [Listeria]KGL42179.1 teichoic acids export protein ATP-binding subunit [Listeriaceae bacterium FSL A5-0209]KGL38228.1 teichoic acids export protein ATP-binding subunit [Listeria newyorkensis]KMT63392.1 teichoic acids export, ATP-binding protein TagH [Listeria newyorkensis]PNP94342.1 teichoic acid export protein ATP-binding subunit [Listeria newyorkensis]RQW67698.1 ABC transporter ATP-binding protein [Listeria sp. SHR_NRA_18]